MPTSKLIKALLLNIFVIPGSGHLVFKRKLRGGILMTIVLALVIAMIAHLTILIQQQLLLTATATRDIAKAYQIAQDMSKDVMAQNIGMIKNYLYALACCYLFGIGDLIWIYIKSNNLAPKGQNIK